MRRSLAILPAVAMATALFAQAPAAKKAAPVTPRKADEFVIHMIDGSQKLLSSYRGKTLAIAFMYTTCTHCQHTAGVLAKVQTEYAAKGVQVLGVTIDQGAKDGTKTFIQFTGANFPVGYSTPDLAMKWLHGPPDGWYVPMLAFVDQTGTVRDQYVVLDPGDTASKWLEGQDSDPKTGDKGNIRKELDKLLKGSALPVQAKKPSKS